MTVEKTYLDADPDKKSNANIITGEAIYDTPVNSAISLLHDVFFGEDFVLYLDPANKAASMLVREKDYGLLFQDTIASEQSSRPCFRNVVFYKEFEAVYADYHAYGDFVTAKTVNELNETVVNAEELAQQTAENLSGHVNETSPHGATSSNIAGNIPLRNEHGSFEVGAAQSAYEPVRKIELDDEISAREQAVAVLTETLANIEELTAFDEAFNNAFQEAFPSSFHDARCGELVYSAVNFDLNPLVQARKHLFILDGSPVPVADYQKFCDYVWVGEERNATSDGFYRASNIDGTWVRDVDGDYLMLPDAQGLYLQGAGINSITDSFTKSNGSVVTTVYNGGDIGQRSRDEIRNIAGSLYIGGAGVTGIISSLSGVFYGGGTGITGTPIAAGGNLIAYFSASREIPTGNTTHPASLSVNICIAYA
jgi:hypothetical protein